MRVLIVEDATDVAEAVAIRLRKSGMACDVADCVATAEDFLAVQTYQAIVLDINLPAQKSDEVALGPLRFSAAALTATLDQKPLDLTRREATLLGMLLRHQGQVVSKQRLYDGLFAFDDADVGLNAIELYIARLRKKLTPSPVRIETQRGLGYRIFQDD